MTLPILFRYLAAFELFPSVFYVVPTLQTVYIDICTWDELHCVHNSGMTIVYYQ